MKRPILIDSFKDHSFGDHVYQINTKEESIGIFCDCCEDQITQEENIGTEEDFCYKCYESGGVSRYLKNSLNFNADEHYRTMMLIQTKYEKFKNEKKE